MWYMGFHSSNPDNYFSTGQLLKTCSPQARYSSVVVSKMPHQGYNNRPLQEISSYTISISSTLLLLKENLNASKSSEHLLIQGKVLSKHLGRNIGCKYKNFSWNLIVFPNGSSIIVSTVISWRNPPLHCTMTSLIATQVHQRYITIT